LNWRRRAYDPDIEFIADMFAWLTESQVGWDQFFHDWHGGGASLSRANESQQAARYAEPAFSAIRHGLEARTNSSAATRLSHSYFQQSTPVSLVIDDVEAVWAPIAERDDWSLFEAKLSAIGALRHALGILCHDSVAEQS
jgi:hypothetical protein